MSTPKWPGRLGSIAIALVGLFLLLFGVVGLAAALNKSTTLHHGEIVDREIETLTFSHPYSHAEIPQVHVVANGEKHVVESTPLYDIAGRRRLPIPVLVRVDSIGGFKGVEYRGRWYNAEAPVGVQIAFAAVALVLSVGCAWWVVRRHRRSAR